MRVITRNMDVVGFSAFAVFGVILILLNFDIASSATLQQVAPVSDPYVMRAVTDNTQVTEIYEDGLGTIMYREHDGTNVRVERVATDDEATAYIAHRDTVELQRAYATAVARLSGDVGVTGQKQVEWLRDRADDANNAVAQWDSWNQAQKDTALQQLFDAQAKTWDGLADLLIFLNKQLGVDAGLDTE